MQKVQIELEQSWDTLDRAINYFQDIAKDLEVLKRLPEPPTDLFLMIETGDKNLDEKILDNFSITLTNL